MSVLDLRDRILKARDVVWLIDMAASDLAEKRQHNPIAFATETLVDMLESIEADLGKVDEADS